MFTTYPIGRAKIVATFAGGGAIVETRNLQFVEGRSPSVATANGERIPTLAYTAAFDEPAGQGSDSATLENARIVIIGAVGGRYTEIRGNGWIGYTGEGHITGFFEAPPSILIDADDIVSGVEPDAGDEPDLDTSHWQANDELPPEFKRATLKG
ncbi:hypothetical protein [Sphingomonas sp. VNH70]|uniref:hypothetical protein n=1 Tax=Sphingomonas silueang TaxID=3156617 RepID=UPI0032B46F3F